MAYRDQSQGFGFVYVDLAKILSERTKLSLEDLEPSEYAESAPSVNLNRDPVVQAQPQSVEKLKDNLDRLQQLHHKLHAMLEELSTMAENEKKRRKK